MNTKRLSECSAGGVANFSLGQWPRGGFEKERGRLVRANPANVNTRTRRPRSFRALLESAVPWLAGAGQARGSVLLALVFAICWLGTVLNTRASTVFVVNNLNDDDSYLCLRKAVQASLDGDTITFAPNVRGTIVLTNEILIDHGLTII